jgi:hypothetical protein
LLTNFSYFEVPEQDARFVIKDMNGADWHGRKVVVSPANEDHHEEEKPKKKKRAQRLEEAEQHLPFEKFRGPKGRKRGR